MTRFRSLAPALGTGLAAGLLLCGLGAAPASAATTRTAAVYYVGDTGRRAALYREFRQVPVVGGPIRTAVEAMLHVPPRDPDYKSLWPRASRIRGISVRSGIATVDLTAVAATGTAGSAFACASLQQLVYTVTAANPTVRRVALRINGRRSGVVSGFWGVGCGRDVSMPRQPGLDILAPVQISNVLHAQFVSRSFIVSGEATVFEAVVSWSVTDQATRRVLRGGATMADMQATKSGIRGPWAVRVNLPVTEIGRAVVVRAWEASAKDGSVTNLDTKALRVR